MASNQRTVDFLVEQLSSAGEVVAKKLFGEYAVYCDGKLVAPICDDNLFVKPTAPGRLLLGAVAEAPPYPGARPYLAIPGGRWDEAEWLGTLIRATADALPPPKPKAKKQR